MNSSPRIAIIGAGLAGLTAGYRLYQKNFPVTIYETRNRVGGRVFTINIANSIVEMGGQNILDGGNADNICTLAEELGLETEFKKRTFTLNYSDGKSIVDSKELFAKKKISPDKLKEKLQTLKTHASNMQEVLKNLFGDDDALYSLCSTRLAAYEGASVEKLSSYYVDTLYHLLLGGLSSTHQNKNEEENYPLQTLNIKNGNGLLTEKLAEKLSGKVHLNHALKELEKHKDGSYCLTFQNGTKAIADIVVLATPCPTFKNIAIDHSIMSSDKQKTIQSIQYGTNTKIAIPIIPEESSHEAYGNERFIAFTNQNNHILNLYYVGDHGRFDAENFSEIFQKDLPFVRDFYRVHFSNKPVIAKDKAFASYEGPVGHSWPEDPFSGGSYSCVGTGQDEVFTSMIEIEGETVKKLFAPIENSLFFAGEHTTSHLHITGTMEAAVESGEKTARLIEKQIYKANNSVTQNLFLKV